MPRSILKNPKRLRERAEAFVRAKRAVMTAASELEADYGMTARAVRVARDMEHLVADFEMTARALRKVAMNVEGGG
jgi:hypothetical protein